MRRRSPPCAIRRADRHRDDTTRSSPTSAVLILIRQNVVSAHAGRAGRHDRSRVPALSGSRPGTLVAGVVPLRGLGVATDELGTGRPNPCERVVFGGRRAAGVNAPPRRCNRGTAPLSHLRTSSRRSRSTSRARCCRARSRSRQRLAPRRGLRLARASAPACSCRASRALVLPQPSRENARCTRARTTPSSADALSSAARTYRYGACPTSRGPRSVANTGAPTTRRRRRACAPTSRARRAVSGTAQLRPRCPALLGPPPDPTSACRRASCAPSLRGLMKVRPAYVVQPLHRLTISSAAYIRVLRGGRRARARLQSRWRSRHTGLDCARRALSRRPIATGSRDCGPVLRGLLATTLDSDAMAAERLPRACGRRAPGSRKLARARCLRAAATAAGRGYRGRAVARPARTSSAGPVPGVGDAHSHPSSALRRGASARTPRATLWSWRDLHVRVALASPRAAARDRGQRTSSSFRRLYTHVCDFHYLRRDRAAAITPTPCVSWPLPMRGRAGIVPYIFRSVRTRRFAAPSSPRPATLARLARTVEASRRSAPPRRWSMPARVHSLRGASAERFRAEVEADGDPAPPPSSRRADADFS